MPTQLTVTHLSWGGLPRAGPSPASSAANDPNGADACHLLSRSATTDGGTLVQTAKERGMENPAAEPEVRVPEAAVPDLDTTRPHMAAYTTTFSAGASPKHALAERANGRQHELYVRSPFSENISGRHGRAKDRRVSRVFTNAAISL